MESVLVSGGRCLEAKAGAVIERRRQENRGGDKFRCGSEDRRAELSEDISWRDGEQDTRGSCKVNNISLVNVKEQ